MFTYMICLEYFSRSSSNNKIIYLPSNLFKMKLPPRSTIGTIPLFLPCVRLHWIILRVCWSNIRSIHTLLKLKLYIIYKLVPLKWLSKHICLFFFSAIEKVLLDKNLQFIGKCKQNEMHITWYSNDGLR